MGVKVALPRFNRVAYPTIVISDKSVIPSAQTCIVLLQYHCWYLLSGLLSTSRSQHTVCTLSISLSDIYFSREIVILCPGSYFSHWGTGTRMFGLRASLDVCPWGPSILFVTSIQVLSSSYTHRLPVQCQGKCGPLLSMTRQPTYCLRSRRVSSLTLIISCTSQALQLL